MKSTVMKALSKQIKKDPQLGVQITGIQEKIAPLTREQLSSGGFQLEPLKHDQGKLWTIRAGGGDRILCDIVDDTLLLMQIGTHSEIYRRKGSLEEDLLVEAMGLL